MAMSVLNGPKTILMTSTSYPASLSDWRGLFIRHLVHALATRGDVRLRLWAPPGSLHDNAAYVASADEARWLASLMAAGGIAHLVRQGGTAGILAPLRLLRLLRKVYRREDNVDLYHVNWLQNALVLPKNGVPLLVSVLGTDMQLLKLPGMRGLLRRVFRTRRVAICPNANWMVEPLKEYFGDLADVEAVPFGIDPAWFELERIPPRDGPSKWLCVSRLTAAKLGTLFECQPCFDGTNRELHLFGPMQENISLPDWVHYHGPVTADVLCREWFVRASGLITMSKHAEGRPQVMLEAMAASLPIIASQLTAHTDLLEHQHTGWLCANADAVQQALAALDDNDTNARIGLNARDWARKRIGTWDDCASRYAAIYDRLIAS